MTRAEDARAAAGLGVDAIGLVFYPPSPRAVTIAEAERVTRGLPPFVSVVALFVNPEPDAVRAVIDGLAVDLLQFHGDEPPEACDRFGIPYIKAVGVHEKADLAASARRYASARALLLDYHDPHRWGGTGCRFDWSRIPAGLDRPVILAGGLTRENVGDAVREVGPFGVDVSGGVESAKGIKDAAMMAAFIREVEGVRAE